MVSFRQSRLHHCESYLEFLDSLQKELEKANSGPRLLDTDLAAFMGQIQHAQAWVANDDCADTIDLAIRFANHSTTTISNLLPVQVANQTAANWMESAARRLESKENRRSELRFLVRGSAEAYLSLDEFSDAARLAKWLHAISTAEIDLLLSIELAGRISMRLSAYRKALTLFKKASLLGKSTRDLAWLSRTYLSCGECSWHMKRYWRATRYFKRAISIQLKLPNFDPQVLCTAAMYLSQRSSSKKDAVFVCQCILERISRSFTWEQSKMLPFHVLTFLLFELDIPHIDLTLEKMIDRHRRVCDKTNLAIAVFARGIRRIEKELYKAACKDLSECEYLLLEQGFEAQILSVRDLLNRAQAMVKIE